jgi:polyisoprenoid-binding protein YceI
MRASLETGILAGTWVLDRGASVVRLRSKIRPGLPVRGVFREVSGCGTVARDGTASGTLSVAAGSVATGNARRDQHLRSADFFDSDRYPDITFTADRIRASGQVSGMLTIRGRTRPLSFAAAPTVAGHGEIRLDAEVGIDRGDFGLTWNFLGMIPMVATISVHAVFTREPS